MTGRKKTSKRAGAKKLKLKKETLKDLDPKGGAVKGGMAAKTRSCEDSCRVCVTASCLC